MCAQRAAIERASREEGRKRIDIESYARGCVSNDVCAACM